MYWNWNFLIVLMVKKLKSSEAGLVSVIRQNSESFRVGSRLLDGASLCQNWQPRLAPCNGHSRVSSMLASHEGSRTILQTYSLTKTN